MSNNSTLELKHIKPLNKTQEALLNSSKNLIVHGCAGTGKTFTLLYKALKQLENKKVEKIIIFRSTVATRDVGFLPGKLADKVKVYEEPYEDIVDKLYDQRRAYVALKKTQKIDFKPTSFIRGISLDNAFVIVDEFQNMSEHELHTVMTRLGNNTTIAFSGDTDQTDLKSHSIGNFIHIVKMLPHLFDHIEFDENQVVRSKLVREYLKARKEFYAQSSDSSKDLPRRRH